MIAFPRLGQLGQLGNQMFQMAATIALAAEHGDTFGFPRWICQHAHMPVPCNPPCHSIYSEFPHLDPFFHDSLPEGPPYCEPHFHHAAIPYRPDLRLHGYFQSEKYFRGHADLVRHYLTPASAARANRLKGVASLHVRRGDFVYAQIDPRYYERSVYCLSSGRGVEEFLVFSHDPGWCREFLRIKGATYVETGSSIEHFVRMLLCEHHVISNSTFAWWAAWLDPNPGKAVICPDSWFTGAHVHSRTTDLFPPEWIRI